MATTGQLSDEYPTSLSLPGPPCHLGRDLSAVDRLLDLFPATVFQKNATATGKPIFLHDRPMVPDQLPGQHDVDRRLAPPDGVLSLVLMIILLTSLIAIYRCLYIGRVVRPRKNVDAYPFSVYLGWISVATIATVTTLLVHWG